MQALSKAAAGKSYTIKWMFGIPEVLDKIRKCKIDEGSEITVIQNSGRDLIIRSGEKPDRNEQRCGNKNSGIRFRLTIFCKVSKMVVAR